MSLPTLLWMFPIAFTLHGLMHIGQAVFIRRYVPSLVTSILIVLPYGALLYPRLVALGIVTWPALGLYGLVGVAAILPIILGMHWIGDKIMYGHDISCPNKK